MAASPTTLRPSVQNPVALPLATAAAAIHNAVKKKSIEDWRNLPSPFEDGRELERISTIVEGAFLTARYAEIGRVRTACLESVSYLTHGAREQFLAL